MEAMLLEARPNLGFHPNGKLIIIILREASQLVPLWISIYFTWKLNTKLKIKFNDKKKNDVFRENKRVLRNSYSLI